MGLTSHSTGANAVDSGLKIRKQNPEDKVIAIAGNPNVGKSTLFNSLTGSHQHTGNWPGKTVANAQGWCQTKKHGYTLVDIPGTYSLMAHSAEEEIARNFICFSENDGVVVVCDATCLERNLNLVLQTLEISNRVLVCVNLMDEARRKEITIDLEGLSRDLGVPVVGTVARKKRSLSKMLEKLDELTDHSAPADPLQISYDSIVEQAIHILQPAVQRFLEGKQCRLSPRWLALKLIDPDPSLLQELETFLGEDILQQEEIMEGLENAGAFLAAQNISPEELKDRIVLRLVQTGEVLARKNVRFHNRGYHEFDRRLDRILTSRLTGYPIMLGLIALVFWLTISVSNYPSQLLSDLFFRGEVLLDQIFADLGMPLWLHRMMVAGMYRVLGWVVSVMLPPMAIFFPLFTLLEDSGYLPRIAYNLDKPFKCCRACGKQALTMCMEFEYLQGDLRASDTGIMALSFRVNFGV